MLEPCRVYLPPRMFFFQSQSVLPDWIFVSTNAVAPQKTYPIEGDEQI